MTYNEFYGNRYDNLLKSEQQLKQLIEQYPSDPKLKPIVYITSRIKSPDSMITKLKKRNLKPTLKNALTEVHDAIGIRIVCSFMNDVYDIVNWLKTQDTFDVIKEKDYIEYPKPNGYRSYHLILRLQNGLYAEIQVRTIAIDTWSVIEHQLKYKKDIQHEQLIKTELKSCADQIASLDLTLQTLKDIVTK